MKRLISKTIILIPALLIFGGIGLTAIYRGAPPTSLGKGSAPSLIDIAVAFR